MKLAEQQCKPCEGGISCMTGVDIAPFLVQVSGWEVLKEKEITRELIFNDFLQTIAFLNKIAILAEAQGHHPDLLLHSYKKLKITLSTHSIGGLSENDFILAAGINELFTSETTL